MCATSKGGFRRSHDVNGRFAMLILARSWMLWCFTVLNLYRFTNSGIEERWRRWSRRRWRHIEGAGEGGARKKMVRRDARKGKGRCEEDDVVHCPGECSPGMVVAAGRAEKMK